MKAIKLLLTIAWVIGFVVLIGGQKRGCFRVIGGRWASK